MRGIASWVRGLAQAQAGEVAAADRTFAEAMRTSQLTEMAAIAALSLFTFGLLEMTQGYLGQAHALCQQALEVLSRTGRADDPLSGLVYLSIGELLRLQELT